MNESTYKNYDELSLMLNVVQVAGVLGISRAVRGQDGRGGSAGDARGRRPGAEDRQPHRSAEGQAAGVDRRQHGSKMTTL